MNTSSPSFATLRHTAAKNSTASHGLPLPSAVIPGVALHSADHAAFALFHDSNKIGRSISIPIEEDHVAVLRLIVSILPLPAARESAYTIHAGGEFRDNIAAHGWDTWDRRSCSSPIALQGQFDPLHIDRIFCLCRQRAVRQRPSSAARMI